MTWNFITFVLQSQKRTVPLDANGWGLGGDELQLPLFLYLATKRGGRVNTCLLSNIIRKIKRRRITAVTMEAASTSETSVNFCQASRCYKSEDGHLDKHMRLWP
jgi:hypothetical protein